MLILWNPKIGSAADEVTSLARDLMKWSQSFLVPQFPRPLRRCCYCWHLSAGMLPRGRPRKGLYCKQKLEPIVCTAVKSWKTRFDGFVLCWTWSSGVEYLDRYGCDQRRSFFTHLYFHHKW